MYTLNYSLNISCRIFTEKCIAALRTTDGKGERVNMQLEFGEKSRQGFDDEIVLHLKGLENCTVHSFSGSIGSANAAKVLNEVAPSKEAQLTNPVISPFLFHNKTYIFFILL